MATEKLFAIEQYAGKEFPFTRMEHDATEECVRLRKEGHKNIRKVVSWAEGFALVQGD